MSLKKNHIDVKKIGLIIVIFAITGCFALGRADTKLSAKGLDLAWKERILSSSSTTQITGTDAKNISATLIIQGSGWLIAIAGLLSYLRARKALKGIILAIEKNSDKEDIKQIKVAISKQALQEGIADFLHKLVRKFTDSGSTS